MVQISGKMLIASSSTIVGVMNSQAIARSDRPRDARGPFAGGVAAAGTVGKRRGGFVRVSGRSGDACHQSQAEMPVRNPPENAWSPPAGPAAEPSSASRRLQILPSSLNIFVQSLISRSSASLAVPLSATT